MQDSEMSRAVCDTELYYSILKSIHSFDEMEVKGVVTTLLSPTLAEECVIATYYRASSNVKSLLELKHVKHFQALGMLARSLFELAVEIKLLEIMPDGPLKMRAFMDIEKLKACKAIVKFDGDHGLTFVKDTQVQRSFILREETRILQVSAAIWPNRRINRISHWTLLSLPDRIKLLDVRMQEMYADFYRQLSWQVHPGLQGTYGLKAETFAVMCSSSYNLSALVYEILIASVVKALKLSVHDPKLDEKMKLARYLPFTETAEDELLLRRGLGLT